MSRDRIKNAIEQYLAHVPVLCSDDRTDGHYTFWFREIVRTGQASTRLARTAETIAEPTRMLRSITSRHRHRRVYEAPHDAKQIKKIIEEEIELWKELHTSRGR
jgi:hypothetical protein